MNKEDLKISNQNLKIIIYVFLNGWKKSLHSKARILLRYVSSIKISTNLAPLQISNNNL